MILKETADEDFYLNKAVVGTGGLNIAVQIRQSLIASRGSTTALECRGV